MARSKNAPGPGHNVILDDEEIAALEAYYAQKIKAGLAEVEVAASVVKAKREAVNSLFAGVKQDLKTSRKDFEDLLAKQAMTPAEFMAFWGKLSARYQRNGLPVGAQQELFPIQGDTVDDQAAANAAGHRAGRNGEDPTPPKEIAGVLHQDWLAGWHEGQKELYLQLEKADGILAKLKQAGGELTEGDEDEELEPEDELEALDAEARKLKASGWTKPTADETDFATAGAA